jgi:hypothetical protein
MTPPPPTTPPLMSDEKPRPWAENWQAQRTLEILQRGPASTIELQADEPLVHVARQIWELRHWYGHTIRTRRLPNRVAVYELVDVTYPVAIVGSLHFGRCPCAPSWPPTDAQRYHIEDCPKVMGGLLVRTVVTRLAGKHPDLTIITTGSPTGAEAMVQEAATMLGVPLKVMAPRAGSASFAMRAEERNAKLVEKVEHVIVLFGPGPRSGNPDDVVRKARAYDVPLDIWHEGQWRKQ